MICIAKPENVEIINELGKKINQNFNKSYNIINYIDNNNYIILVNKDKIINAFLLIYKNIDNYEIEAIVVDDKCRNFGIASKLLSFFINEYCKINDVILLEVSCKNTSALNLYKKFGFEIINIRKKYYNNIDAYIMKKVIK